MEINMTDNNQNINDDEYERYVLYAEDQRVRQENRLLCQGELQSALIVCKEHLMR